MQEPPIDRAVIDDILARVGRERRHLLAILQAIQGHYRYLPQAALERVADLTAIPPAQVVGVASFYGQFRFRPAGRHMIRVCHGTACHLAGAPLITETLRRHLAIADPDADTSADRFFTVEKVSCFGCCSLAPVMKIDEETYGHLTPERATEVVEAFRERQAAARSGRRGKRGHSSFLRSTLRAAFGGKRGMSPFSAMEIRVGLGSCCVASGSGQVAEALAEAIRATGCPVAVKSGACVGMCHRAPLVEVLPAKTGRAPTAGAAATYGNVTPAAAKGIVRRHLAPAGPLRRARAALDRALDFFFDETALPSVQPFRVEPESDAVRAFLAKQKHIVLEHRGQIDPMSIVEYRMHDGYRALTRCVTEMTPEAVIAAVEQSGLRGRGGAGFPTGRKWASVRREAAPQKFIVMNGDEGDPGAFMDRMMLESYPHRVLEGLVIAAYAVGATRGFLYIRAEYPLALERVRHALRQATEAGFLGERILGTDFSLHLEVVEGAGAFVCGEETGLMASIEGRRGMPRFRPPYPAQVGLWGRPTCINNVETLANVPWIIRHGPAAFAAMGAERSKGTKVFALAGKINRGGLIEVPMGLTIREIVEEVGGGIRDGRGFKAVQIGGPSGGCIPERLADTPIDYEALTRVGAMMGSGGLVVLDDTACMVEVARFFLEFTQRESCGRCTFCRIGTKRMLEILERLCAGQGQKGDLDALAHLADRVKRTSLCGLGRTAPNPVLTTLQYFRDEYEAHLEGHCPAKACRALIRYAVSDECIGCTLCAQNCPVNAIELRPYERHEIDQTTCVRCGQCALLCPSKAIRAEDAKAL
jgi:NADH-quinone oxidoreductase subunit F